MFRVWWLQEALDDVAAQWIGADAEPSPRRPTRSTCCWRETRSDAANRPDGRRLAFVPPLGFYYRLEDDEKTVVVLQAWVFRKRKQ
jgi:hypothetical protein